MVASVTPASQSLIVTVAGRHVREHHVHHRLAGITLIAIVPTAIDASRAHRAGGAARRGSRCNALSNVNASAGVGPPAWPCLSRSGLGSSDVVMEARRYLGGNPTGRGSLWCATVHEFGAAALRPSRHRLGYGKFVCQLRPPRLLPAGRRHRGDGAARRRACRRRQRHDANREIRSWCRATTDRVREAPISRGRIYAYVMLDYRRVHWMPLSAGGRGKQRAGGLQQRRLSPLQSLSPTATSPPAITSA